MSKFTNFVRGELVNAIGAGDSVTIKIAFGSGRNVPTDPDGAFSRLVLMDDQRRPTKFEIITFSGYTVLDNTITLTGITRGVDGTADQAWSAGAVVAQDLPASIMNILTVASLATEYMRVGEDGFFAFEQIDAEELFWGAESGGVFIFSDGAPPTTPAADRVGIYLDATAKTLNAVFDDGSTSVIS